MDARLKRALDDYRAALEEMLGDNLLEMRLFGSRARGDAEADSDVDVSVRVKECSLDLEFKIVALAADLSREHDLLIMPFIWKPERWEGNRELDTLLYRDIMNEGIRI